MNCLKRSAAEAVLKWNQVELSGIKQAFFFALLVRKSAARKYLEGTELLANVR